MAKTYVGRFAPSPTGPLHAGSLVAALASYLDARAIGGRWLVRIEDIDPPREIPGASIQILSQLEKHGLHWDGEICYQSRGQERYLAALETLSSKKLLFACSCTREYIRSKGGHFDNNCRKNLVHSSELAVLPHQLGKAGNRGTAIRVNTDTAPIIRFNDLIFGPQRFDWEQLGGDFAVFRRDQQITYQLATAVDDAHQNISHVVRGDDLLDSTPRQIFLLKTLDSQTKDGPAHITLPQYGHIPVVVDRFGKKLSKQHKTPALDPDTPATNLYRALQWLKQDPPLALGKATTEDLLAWATEHWERKRLTAAIK